MKVLKPYYYDQFHCIGSQCIQTCCHGWDIPIDPSTYNKYQNVENEFGKRLRQNITTPTTKKFVLDDHGKCGLLNKNGLCDIYLNIGEDMMCDTCKTYPRVTKIRADIYEQTLSLSCPEVSRILIENRAPIDFCIGDTDDDKNDAVPVNDELFNALLLARSYSIELLQNRTISFTNRQLLLLYFTEKFQKLLNAQEYSKVSSLINQFNDNSYLSIYIDQFDKIDKNLHAKYNILNQLLEFPLPTILSFNPYIKSIYERQIINKENATIESIISKHEEEFNSNYTNNQHVYENYYVHSVFKYYLDALDDNDIMKQLLLINVGFSIIHLFDVLAYIDSDNQLTSEHQSLIFRGFASAFEHTKYSFEKIHNLLVAQDLVTFSFQALLLK